MAFRILTNRDLSVEDLKNIVASSNGNSSTNENRPSFWVYTFFARLFCRESVGIFRSVLLHFDRVSQSATR